MTSEREPYKKCNLGVLLKEGVCHGDFKVFLRAQEVKFHYRFVLGFLCSLYHLHFIFSRLPLLREEDPFF